jgi:tetratricopeptide (TPR) repeat protein
MADLLLIGRKYDESIRQSRRTLDIDPRFAVAHYQLGQALVQKKTFSEAIDEFQSAIGFSPGNKTFTANLAYAYAVSGQRAEAIELLNRLLAPTPDSYSAAAEIGVIYVGLGDKDRAMQSLERAYEQRFNPSLLLRPCFDPIRQDPRFQDLLRRVGLRRTATN